MTPPEPSTYYRILLLNLAAHRTTLHTLQANTQPHAAASPEDRARVETQLQQWLDTNDHERRDAAENYCRALAAEGKELGRRLMAIGPEARFVVMMRTVESLGGVRELVKAFAAMGVSGGGAGEGGEEAEKEKEGAGVQAVAEGLGGLDIAE